VQYGINCKIHRNTASYGTPTWVVDGIMGDAKLNLTYGEGESTTRAGGGFKTYEPTLLDASLEFDIKCDQSDTGFQAYETAFFAKTALDIAALSGPIATPGSRGLRARWKMFSFPRDEAADGIVFYSVVLKPCQDLANPPAWIITPAE